MGVAMEIVDTFATNPGVGPAFATSVPFPGDVLAVRNFPDPSQAFLLDVYGLSATAGAARIRSPRLHDNVQGIRFREIAATNRALLPDGVTQKLYAQDALVVEQFGGAAETDGFGYVVYYENLPGSAANLHTFADIAGRILNYVNVEVAVAAAAPIGTRSAASALNATMDLLIANTDYALIGYESDVNGLSVGFRGVDTGNLRLGGPMTTERIETRDWFMSLGAQIGKPTIPVINSANKSGFLIDTAQVVIGVAANITLLLAQLTG